MKYEWRKKEKELYLPKDKPVLITVPEQKFLMISGKGRSQSGRVFGKSGRIVFFIIRHSNDAEKRLYTGWIF